jgi:RHS repeat-associated protein
MPTTYTGNLTGSPTALRTTTTTYDGAERARHTVTTTNTTAGATAGTLTTDVAFDDAGNQTTLTNGTSTTTTATDVLGRAYLYTDGSGLQTTTNFNSYGQVASSDTYDTTATGTTSHVHFATSYAYDPVTGDLTSTVDPSTGTMTYSRDVTGTPVTATVGGAAVGALTETTLSDTTGAPVRRTWKSVTGGVTTTYVDEQVGGTTGGGETADGQQVDDNLQVTAKTLDATGTPAASSTTTTRIRRYGYDSLNRLVSAADSRVVAGSTTPTCVIRSWAYDNNSNRTGQGTTAPAANSTCVPTGQTGVAVASGYTPPAATASPHTYDTADRITDTGYAYDGLGRTTTLATGATNQTLTYYPNDRVAGQTVNGGTPTQSQTYSLDATNSRYDSSTTTISGTATTIKNRYDSSSDNPALIVEANGNVTRYVDGGFTDMTAAVTLTPNGANPNQSVTWQLTNLHGDIIANLSDLAGGAAVAVAATDEYGTRLDTSITSTYSTAADRYSWIGGKQRSDNTRGGLTLMGARLYNPTTGRFLSVDPVPGGSAGPYLYPTDPINGFDLDGNHWCPGCGKLKAAVKTSVKVAKKAGHLAIQYHGVIVSAAAVGVCFISAPACMVGAGIAFASRARDRAAAHGGYRATWRATVGDAVFTMATMGAVGGMSKLAKETAEETAEAQGAKLGGKWYSRVGMKHNLTYGAPGMMSSVANAGGCFAARTTRRNTNGYCG